MSFFITLLISILSHQDDSSIRGMALSEVYLKADEMKSFAFESKDYIDTVRSVAFDFIALEPVSQIDYKGYYQSYYNERGIHKVVRFSSKGEKEYVVYVDARSPGYSFLWLFSYEEDKSMLNGFFLNIDHKDLYFVGLSEPMGSSLEVINSNGEIENFDFGKIYTLPEGDVGSVIGQIASVDKDLSPLAILHYRSGKPFGLEYFEDSTLHIFSFSKYDCEQDIPILAEMDFFKIEAILKAEICFGGKVFNLQKQYGSSMDYYSKRTF